MRPGSPDDQTAKLQRAIDDAARAQVPLALPPGVYRTGMLRLQNGAQLVGVRGATKLVFNGGASLLSGEGAYSIGLTGITLDIFQRHADKVAMANPAMLTDPYGALIKDLCLTACAYTVWSLSPLIDSQRPDQKWRVSSPIAAR